MSHPDDRVHRCGDCGTWCYGTQPCGTCVIATQYANHAWEAA